LFEYENAAHAKRRIQNIMVTLNPEIANAKADSFVGCFAKIAKSIQTDYI